VTASRLNEEPRGNGASERPFALEERTQFGEAIVRFAKKIPRNPANDRLISQLVGCGTSVGANYCEADERVSKKDFRNTIGRCVKEAKETRYFLRMIAASAGGRSATVVSRSKRTASDLGEHLPEMTMRSSVGIWSLELLWDLDLGIWDFRS
jgi:four helix bundle protein